MSGVLRLTSDDYDLLLSVFDDWIAEGFTSTDSPLMQRVEGLRTAFAEARAEALRSLEHVPP